MAKVLFLSIPSHGHMNPMLGLANELINNGESITFFSSDEFKKAIEDIGAEFMPYKEDMNIFRMKQGDNKAVSPGGQPPKPKGGLVAALLQPEKFVDDILAQVKDMEFDYIVHSAAYPFANVIAQVLGIPAISSFAVFITLKEMIAKGPEPQPGSGKAPLGLTPDTMMAFRKVRQSLVAKYNVSIPEDIFNSIYSKGDLNIIYTSKYFIRNLADYDDSYIFVGAPVYNKKYNVDFPFEKLEGKRVIYISLGTIFGNHSTALNKMFFESFKNMDAVIVMAAHNVDASQYDIPANFIVRDYVPQLEILKYASAAITHAGMSSIGDLMYNNIPFVSIPLGADQFYLAGRAQELGATIVLDSNTITSQKIRTAIDKVQADPSYIDNIKKISKSFVEAGGYRKAVEAIFKLKEATVIATS